MLHIQGKQLIRCYRVCVPCSVSLPIFYAVFIHVFIPIQSISPFANYVNLVHMSLKKFIANCVQHFGFSEPSETKIIMDPGNYDMYRMSC